jgi:hypothetical protein
MSVIKAATPAEIAAWRTRLMVAKVTQARKESMMLVLRFALSKRGQRFRKKTMMRATGLTDNPAREVLMVLVYIRALCHQASTRDYWVPRFVEGEGVDEIEERFWEGHTTEPNFFTEEEDGWE